MATGTMLDMYVTDDAEPSETIPEGSVRYDELNEYGDPVIDGGVATILRALKWASYTVGEYDTRSAEIRMVGPDGRGVAFRRVDGRRWVLAILAAIALLAPGCIARHLCTPGQQAVCECFGVQRGSQTCSDDGRFFFECRCDGQHPDTVDSDAVVAPDAPAVTAESGPDASSGTDASADAVIPDTSPACSLSGEMWCAGRCAATLSDGANCGACGEACPAGSTCTSGHCSALPAYARCTESSECGAPTRCLSFNTGGNPTCSPGCATADQCPEAPRGVTATPFCRNVTCYLRCGAGDAGSLSCPAGQTCTRFTGDPSVWLCG